MTKEQQKKSIHDAVMEKIRTDHETMRPRWHFILMTALFITGLFIGILILLFIVSFVFFTLDSSGSWFLSVFGWRGIWTFFSSLPWLLILLGIILIILLEILARRFSFVYRRPLLYSLMAVISLIAIFSLIISRTQLHKNFNNLAERGRLPLVGHMYRNFGSHSNRDVHVGIINEITDYGFKMDDRQGNALLVIITPETTFPSGTDPQKGDRIIVLGTQSDHTIKASSISTININAKSF